MDSVWRESRIPSLGRVLLGLVRVGVELEGLGYSDIWTSLEGELWLVSQYLNNEK